MRRVYRIVTAAAATALLAGCSAQAPADRKADAAVAAPAAAAPADSSDVNKRIADWPNRPRLGAIEMIAKYGEPQEATSEKLVWHNAGQYKRIMVTKAEVPHDFPMPHMDFLEHTITYRVPSDKATALLAYDGSVTLNRTAGEMSARCDLEGHNILTLNLAHDIVTGKKDADAARKAFGQIVQEDIMGKQPPYVMALQFAPPQTGADPGTAVIAGAPKRATDEAVGTSGSGGGADGEVLATVLAVDMNEVLAAAEAGKEKLSPEVMAFAKMLHTEHGAHLGESIKLGQTIGVTPLDTPAVDALKVKGAGVLLTLIPKDGGDFEADYLDALIKGHTETLATIDNDLMKKAGAPQLQAHLKATREAVAGHLEKAKQLKDSRK